MSMVRLNLLFLLALAVVPAIADEKVTVKDVTFECKVTGSDKDGFDLTATRGGKNEEKCKASCTLTKKDGSKTTWTYETTVRGGTAPAIQSFGGEGGIPGAPLSNPEVTASCE